MPKSLTAKARLQLILSAFVLSLGVCTVSSASDHLHVRISDLSVLQSHAHTAQEIQLSISGRDYSLKLWPSSTTHKLTQVGSKHYKGEVIGDGESWVRLSYQNKQLSGYVKAYGELLEIDSLGNDGSATQIARKLSSADLKLRTSGLDRVLHAPPANPKDSHASLRSNISRLIPRSRGVTRIMRLSIIVDSRFDEQYKGRGLEKAIAAINGVDGVYQEQFGLAIQLDSARLLSAENDPFLNYNGNIEQLLRAFRNYSLQNKDFSDGQTAVHLFTGSKDKDNIIGLSWINTACRKDGYNASVSTAFSEQMLLAAHELAHNLGAVHDNAKSCDIEYNNIMWPNISSATASRFSDCSKAAVVPKLNASCNLDNIDVGIALELKQGFTFDRKTDVLEITAHNAHAYREAENIHSATLIHDGISVSNLPDQCFRLADTVYCDHGTIKPLSSSSVEFEISFSKAATQIVRSEIDAPEINDIARTNNIVVFDLNKPEQYLDNDDPFPGTPSTDASAGGAAGVLGYLMSLSLFLLAAARSPQCPRLVTKRAIASIAAFHLPSGSAYKASSANKASAAASSLDSSSAPVE